MDRTMLRMLELGYHGFFCSQILVILALEAQGKGDPDLVRAMGGLAHGHGSEEGVCGTLTGGTCVLSLYAGKGTEEEFADEQLQYMTQDLVAWFTATFGSRYGGINCCDIIGDRSEMRQRCADVVAQTWGKVQELLDAGGYDMSCGKD